MFFFLEDAVAFNRGYLILDVLLHCDFLLISQIRKLRKNTDFQKKLAMTELFELNKYLFELM